MSRMFVLLLNAWEGFVSERGEPTKPCSEDLHVNPREVWTGFNRHSDNTHLSGCLSFIKRDREDRGFGVRLVFLCADERGVAIRVH